MVILLSGVKPDGYGRTINDKVIFLGDVDATCGSVSTTNLIRVVLEV